MCVVCSCCFEVFFAVVVVLLFLIQEGALVISAFVVDVLLLSCLVISSDTQEKEAKRRRIRGSADCPTKYIMYTASSFHEAVSCPVLFTDLSPVSTLTLTPFCSQRVNQHQTECRHLFHPSLNDEARFASTSD